jgi:folate-binding protein YgfZ
MVAAEDYRVLHEGAGLVDRSGRGRLLLTGADRRSLLQGLLTNDVLALTAGTGCYAALLTPNGRMVADMRVLELGDALLLDLDHAAAAPMLERLDSSIFTEDVQLRDVTAERPEIGVYGPAAATAIAAASGEAVVSDALVALPEHGSRTVDIGGAPVLAVRSAEPGVDGFDLVVNADAASDLRARLRGAGAADVGLEAAETTRVEAGRPLFPVDMDADTIPLEAGIESRAISFTKGCYVGQEIIIRVLHRGGGRVARRLVGLVLEPGAAAPSRGTAIAAGDRVVGAVTSAVLSPAVDRAIALGYVHRDFSDPGTGLRVGPAGSGTSAVVTALPFTAAPTSPA